MRRSFFFLGLVLSGVSLIVPLAVAQAQSVVPLVYAQDLTISVGPAGLVTGTFMAKNGEARAVSDLRYELVVLGPLPSVAPGQIGIDNALAYDQFVSSDTFSLLPQAAKQISFVYQPLALPEGNYRLRVHLKTSNDRGMGWDTVPLTRGGRSAFGLLRAQSVDAESNEVGTGAARNSWQPLEGVNVNPEQAVTLRATAELTSAEPLTALSTLTIRRGLTTTTTPETVTGETITLTAGSPPMPLAFPLKSYSTPGAYELVWRLVDPQTRQPLSTVAEFRYVVRGTSASVTNVQIQEFRPEAGNTSVIDFVIVGPADRQTTLAGSVEVSLLNNDAVAGSTTVPVQLSRAIFASTAYVTATSAITSPGIRLVLRSGQGDVLDTYQVSFSDVSAAQLAEATRGALGVPWLWYAGGGVLLMALVLLIALIITRRYRRPPSWPMTVGVGMVILLLSGGSLRVVTATTYLPPGGGVMYTKQLIGGSGAAISLFVNHPKHGATVQPGRTITYEAQTQWAGCGNYVTQGAFLLESQLGSVWPGWFTQWEQQYANLVGDPRTVGHFTVYPQRGWQEVGRLAPPATTPTGYSGFNYFVDVTAPTNARALTFFGRISVFFAPIPGSNDPVFHTIYDDFTRVFVAQPTPTPTVTPSQPTPSPTPTPSPQVSPTPTLTPSPTPSTSPSPSPSPGSFFFWWPFKQTR